MYFRSLVCRAALLALLLLPAVRSLAQVPGITREVWANIGGNAISDLTSNPAYPNSPTTSEILTNSWDCPQNYLESYGQRLRALITAPTTGNYLFWVASDDNGQLWLSTDATPANRRLIASVNTWTSWKEWTKETNQQSAPIALTAGQQYYIEAFSKEGGGGDNLTVRWQLPSGAIEEPIPASRCVAVGAAQPQFTLQPTSLNVVEGGAASFNIAITRSFGAQLQWFRNNTNIPGANGTNYTLAPVSLTDSGSVFRCQAVNVFGVTNSLNATLNVLPDTTRPTIASVGNLGDIQVITVVFSEPVEAATATVSANYTINNGVTVLNAQFGVDTRTVILTTSPLAPNVSYTLTVNNVRDRANTPNTILANSQRTFSLNTQPLDVSFLKLPLEALGPSSHRGGLVISEVMYHPTNRTDLRNIEFIEIYNANPWFEEMGGYRITGAVDYTFPTNFILQGRSFAVVAAVPADLQSVYGLSGVLGPWTGSLQNSSGSLQLRSRAGAVLFDMEYTGDAPYPAAADGAGHSLVLGRPSYGEKDARAWVASDLIGGTPRTNEVPAANSFRAVMINEFLAHTDLPNLDYIELYNYSGQSVNIGRCILTDDPATNKFQIPTNTLIAPRSFLVFTETDLGFRLGAAGETLYLKSPQNNRVIDAVRYEGQENGVATGRFPDGAQTFSRLSARTPGTNNAPVLAPAVVINEIMYHPLSGNAADEFVELYNPSASPIDVSKWRLKDAVKFTIPSGTVIPAGGYLVLAADVLALRTRHPQLQKMNSLGNWEGTLANSGERLTLTKPDQIITTNGLGQPVTNTIHIVMDEVSYGTGGRWPSWTDGDGSSLELRDWRSDRRLAPSWASSDEMGKSAWTTLQATGVMAHGWADANQLHITLQGPGECLVDDVEVFSGGGANLVANSNFASGTSGWVFQGNHNETSWEPGEGFNGPGSLHLRATGRGDSGANRVRTALSTTYGNGTPITVRAKVRWLKGAPNLMLRVRGNWHEAFGSILTANNFGTPGLPNTAATTNAPPAITDVAHWPALPAASQPVLVTARVNDPDGLASLLVLYRIDPATNYLTLAMTNNGAGIFSAVLPAQAAGVQAAFYVLAADRLTPQRGATFPGDAPRRECVVRWGDTIFPGSTLGTYRFWITQRNIDRWSSEELMSNNPKDVTFIYGTNRLVYNAGAWFHGSPYHSPAYNSPVGNSCDYDMGFPPDDTFLGDTDINLFRPGNGGGDGTGQAEIQAYWFGQQFGIPFSVHRPVVLYVNGARRDNLYHDAQQPNGAFVEQWFPDDADGSLHKIQLGFEFGDTAYGAGESGYNVVGANLGRYQNASGGFHIPRYRATWPRRAADPANQYNYTNLFNLVNASLTAAALGSEAYTTTLTNATDVEEWFKVHVVQHLINNPDSFSYGGGQNAFAYKPEFDKWKLFLWDVDFAFGGAANDANLTGIGGADHGPRNDHPPFTRIYYQLLLAAAKTFFSPARSDAILDSRYNGMLAGGGNVSSPSGIKSFIATRSAYILSTIQALNTSPFDVQINGGNDFSTNNNLVTLSGRAPFEVRSIEINGTAYAVTWTTLNNWTLRLALASGTNALSIVGRDLFGNVVSNATDTIRVNVTVPPALPQDSLVLNEIMFRPLLPDAEYVELFNTSSNVSFDLSQWRLDGLDYVFPAGSTISPRAYLVLARDRAAFASAYGAGVVPFDVFPGNLQANGETLRLIKPGFGVTNDLVIDEVRYDGEPPWTTNATGTGSSLQLIDARQDNSRPGNWWARYAQSVFSPAVSTPARTNDGWRFVSATGNVGPGVGGGQLRLVLYLEEAGRASALVDDLTLVSGTNAGVGLNYVRNGDFESPVLLEVPALTNSWQVGTNYTNTAVTGALTHSGNGALRLECSAFANAYPRLLAQNLSPAPPVNSTGTLSFWYWATNSATNLNVRLVNSTGVSVRTNLNIFVSPSNYVPPQLLVAGTNTLSPGLGNTGITNLPAFPTLWLNEVQAENLTGPTDASGEHEPWIELFNAGTNAVVLTNLFLSDTYTNLTNWALPYKLSLEPKQFLTIFCDGQPEQTTPAELHAGFRLAPGRGSVALTRLHTNAPQVLDYVNYVAGLDHSYGSFPDGQPFQRQEFYYVTPAATNDGTLPPVFVRFNEWMADNVGALADPADDNYEDWVEIYNPGATPVSLAGYFLTDVLTNKFKFEIPEGYFVPAGGYLLVWADNEPGQNRSDSPDLHVNFSLARSGEALGLFTPSGVQIDAVTFGPQESDLSQGRFPDGTGPIVVMTNYTPRAANFVPQPNSPPQLATLPDLTVFEGSLLSFTATATDSNFPPQTLVWALEPGAPAGAAIDAATGLFTWLATEAQGGGSYPISLRVTDNGLPPLSATRAFSVSVLKTNNPPVLSIPGDYLANEGDLVTFTASAVDPDLPAQNLTYTLETNSLPAGASIHPNTGVFTWTPTEDQGPGAYTIVVRVTDDGVPAKTHTAPIVLLINESNTPPALGLLADRTASLGQAVNFTLTATDADLPAQALSFDFAGDVPAGATVNATTGEFAWTANQEGTNVFAVRVADNGIPSLSQVRSFQIVVSGSLQIQRIGLTNGLVTLDWGALPGRSYQVEYKSDLGQLSWTTLATNVVATEGRASLVDPVGTNTQRLYRIVLLP